MHRKLRPGAIRATHLAWFILPLMTLVSLAGCSGEGQRAAPVDPGRAREVLRTALESWRRGDPPQALKSASPAIVVQDFDWSAGRKLVGFEVIGDGRDDDANLRIPVRLTMADLAGREVRKDVSYVVGTSPALTVFREMMP